MTMEGDGVRGDVSLRKQGLLGVSRRACLMAAVAPAGWLAAPGLAHAGGQLEEPLMDSVRTALSSAIANQAHRSQSFSLQNHAWVTCAGWAP